MVWVGKMTTGKMPENVYRRGQIKCQSKEINILGGAVTFIPLNEASHHTVKDINFG
jgi:hypothetical protein